MTDSPRPSALDQLRFLAHDLRRANGKHRLRWITCWLSGSIYPMVNYRLSRLLYLLLGARGFNVLRVPLMPILFLIRPWFRGCEIHYEADIGPGLIVLHPGLGAVISEFTIAGRYLTLTGGNCIGRQRQKKSVGEYEEYVIIGDSVTLGANASIIGPLTVGSNVAIGAGAVVVKDVPDQAVMVGVPAVALENRMVAKREVDERSAAR
jgi:serine O-acetyltransferase